MNKKIEFTDWGMIEYNEAWNRQEEIFSNTISNKVANKETDNLLIFCDIRMYIRLVKVVMSIIYS